MKIKYLQQMHDANVGDVKEVTDFEANILIKTGVAKKFGKQITSIKPLDNVEQTGSSQVHTDQPIDKQPENVKE
ncbi:hypothetical protein I2F17_09135 [Acinetobacter sp. B10A]|uniref:hypothetical protein n=1 Tax=Acinetobacter baretiae TaxID=2605383 RepID=UPI001B3CA39E|nr:hypothetical protein [Acinetobacter baretiae]MBF7685979.1 hypothetical protein [Acinetobacter baretiae]